MNKAEFIQAVVGGGCGKKAIAEKYADGKTEFDVNDIVEVSRLSSKKPITAKFTDVGGARTTKRYNHGDLIKEV